MVNLKKTPIVICRTVMDQDFTNWQRAYNISPKALILLIRILSRNKLIYPISSNSVAPDLVGFLPPILGSIRDKTGNLSVIVSSISHALIVLPSI